MSSTELEVRLDALESRVAIERLIYEYAQGFDSQNAEMVMGIWHEGASLLMGETFGDHVGLEAIAQAAKGFWAKTPHMHHWMANPLIDIDGDTATAATALDCFVQDSESGPTQVGGIYRDELERRDGRWGIVTRTFELHYWTPISNWTPEVGSEALTGTSA